MQGFRPNERKPVRKDEVYLMHNKLFNNADPELKKLRDLCLSFPEADEKISHGRPYFFTKKTFAIYGATVKGDHKSGEYDQSLVFYPDEEEAEAIKQDDRIFTPAYWGPWGWLGIGLNAETDWEEIRELVEDSYRQTATKKLMKQLDEILN